MLRIFTVSNSRPDFIEMQMASFKKYLQEPFEMAVFNNTGFDAAQRQKHDTIDFACHQAGALVTDVQKDPVLIAECDALETICRVFTCSGVFRNPNVSAAYAYWWAWKNIISKSSSPILLLDSDAFLS